MAQLTIDEAIDKKASFMLGSPHLDAEEIGEKCPKCGSLIFCLYNDLGGTDYYDNYVHICSNSNCDHYFHSESINSNCGGRQAGEGDECCCFCGRTLRITF